MARQVLICQRDIPPGAQRLVEFTAWYFEGNSRSAILPRDPEESYWEEELRWYLEKYAISDPFNKVRAFSSSKYLQKYGDQLNQAVFSGAFDNINESSEDLHVCIQDSGRNSTFQGLHWEILEGNPDIKRRVIVGRKIKPSHSEDTNPSSRKIVSAFNILLFVSRPKPNEAEPEAADESVHRLVSKPLVQLLGDISTPGIQINLHIVRPGTYKALDENLKQYFDRGDAIHLLHLDMHGEVGRSRGESIAKLKFMKPCGSPDLINAEDVAETVYKYGVRHVILNACESAKGTAGDRANLARVLVERGIDFVFAMSYKVMIKSVTVMFERFYRSLLVDRRDYWTAAADARSALREQKSRPSRFGLSVEVDDWIVPVAYGAENKDLHLEWRESKSVRLQKKLFDSDWYDIIEETEQPIGRDSLILQMESYLLLVSNLMFIHGPSGGGKTCLLKHLSKWWTQTGLARSPCYLDVTTIKNASPLGICRRIIHHLIAQRTADPAAKTGPLHEQNSFSKLLESIKSILSEGVNVNKYTLFILDGLEELRFRGQQRWAMPSKHKTQWREFFAAFRGQRCLLIVSSCSPLSFLDHGMADSQIRLPELDETCSHQLLEASIAVHPISLLEIVLHKDAGDASVVEKILDRLGRLPACIKLLPELMVHSTLRYINESFCVGDDILMGSHSAMQILCRTQAWKISQSVFTKADQFQKMVLRGLAIFCGTCPKHVSGFVAHLYKHDCHTSQLVSAFTYARSNASGTEQRRKLWKSIFVGATLKGYTLYKEIDLIGGVRSKSSLSELRETLLKTGLVWPTGLYQEWRSENEDGMPSEVLRVHPILTLFLRQELDRIPKIEKHKYETAFIDYHIWRTDPYIAWAGLNLDPQGLGRRHLDLLQSELAHSLENFYTAINLSIVRASTYPPRRPDWSYHPSSGFPFRILHVMTRKSLLLVPPQVNAMTVGHYVMLTLKAFLLPSQGNQAAAVPEAPCQCQVSHLLFAAPADQGLPDTEAAAKTLHCLIQCSTWLCLYHMVFDCSQVSSQAKISHELLHQYEEEFNNFNGLSEERKLLGRVDDAIASGFTNIFSDLMVDSSPQENDSAVSKVYRLVLSMQDTLGNYLQQKISLMYTSESCLQTAIRQLNSEVIAILRKIAPLWPSFMREVANKGTESIIYYRMLGFCFSPGEHENGSVDELVDQMADSLDSTPLKLSLEAFVEVISRIQSGVSDEDLFEGIGSVQRLETQIRSKDVCMEGLEWALKYGSIRQIEIFHFTLMQQYMLSENWRGLQNHLDLTWVRERSLSVAELSSRELHLVGYWNLIRGTCEMMLGNLEGAETYLQRALDVAYGNSPSMDYLQFKVLLQLSDLHARHYVGDWPAWVLGIQACALAYLPDHRYFYARNGLILRSIFIVGHLYLLAQMLIAQIAQAEHVRKHVSLEYQRLCLIIASIMSKRVPINSKWLLMRIKSSRGTVENKIWLPTHDFLINQGKLFLYRLEKKLSGKGGIRGTLEDECPEIQLVLAEHEKTVFERG